MTGEYFLDFKGGNVFAANTDPVCLTPDKVEVAVVIEVPNIATVIPEIPPCLDRFLWFIDVF